MNNLKKVSIVFIVVVLIFNLFPKFYSVNAEVETEYSVKIFGGSARNLNSFVITQGDVTAKAGDRIEIDHGFMVTPSKEFNKWEVNKGNVELEDPLDTKTHFIMPAEDVEITALMKEIVYSDTEYEIIVHNGTVTDFSGNEIKKAKAHDRIVINASRPPVGKEFDKWIISDGKLPREINEESNHNIFDMPDRNLELTATYKDIVLEPDEYLLTINNGFARNLDSTIISLDANKAKAGDRIEIDHGFMVTPGKEFNKWEVNKGNVELEDPLDTKTHFIMPAEDVEITALMKEIVYSDTEYEIIVHNGTVTDFTGNEIKKAKAHDRIVINASRPPVGKEFDKWIISDGKLPREINEKSNHNIFDMPDRNLELTATYKDIVLESDEYLLTINNGFARNLDSTIISLDTNKAKAGDRIEINCININIVQSGKEFDKWEINKGNVQLDDSFDTRTYFIMPAENVEITASLKDYIYDNTRYKIKINNGYATDFTGIKITESKRLFPVLIKADPPPEGKVFDKWVANSGLKPSVYENLRENDSLTMPPNDIELTAAYKDLPSGEYAIFVYGGTSQDLNNHYIKTAKAGETIKLTETIYMYEKFVMWEVIDGDVSIEDLYNGCTTFVMPEKNVIIRAVTEQTVTDFNLNVENGKAFNYKGKSISTAKQGEVITLVADPAPKGKVFDRWYGRDMAPPDFDDPFSEITTFSMTRGHATFVASYKSAPDPLEPEPSMKYNVIVNSGTVKAEKNITKFEAGEKIEIVADSAAGGKVFDKWIVNRGNIVLDDSKMNSTSFIMPEEDVEVTATYKSAPLKEITKEPKADTKLERPAPKRAVRTRDENKIFLFQTLMKISIFGLILTLFLARKIHKSMK